MSGTFQDTVEFDPGSGIDEHTAVASVNAFLTKLASDGSYLWTSSFQAEGNAFGGRIDLDSTGDILLASGFDRTVDFDPGLGIDERTAVGSRDIYVTKLHADGSYVWTRTFGGAGLDGAKGVATDAAGRSFFTGAFRGTG